MKKILALALAMIMIFALAACDTANTNGTTTTPTTTPKFDPLAKDEGTMTYAEYAAAAIDAPVVVECFVQAHQSWWENKITVYAQDPDGAYFMYNMTCPEADKDKLVPGTKIKVTGYKAAYKGEVEIIDCTFEIMEGTWIAEPTDVTSLLAADNLIDYQNRYVAIKGATIAASTDGEGKEAAFLYNWDGSGTPGSDLYFNITVDGKTYNMCVESYLCGKDTDVYKAVEGLKIGDTVDLTGFLYWYDGVNPHITGVTVK